MCRGTARLPQNEVKSWQLRRRSEIESTGSASGMHWLVFVVVGVLGGMHAIVSRFLRPQRRSVAVCLTA